MSTVPRSLPLAVCLVIGVCGLVIAATATVTVVAHRWAVDALETRAQAELGFAASRRAARVSAVMDADRRSLNKLMEDARLECGYALEGGGMLWTLPCLEPLMTRYHAGQRFMAGLQVIRGDQAVLQYGVPVKSDAQPQSPDEPVLVSAPSGDTYQLRGVQRGLTAIAEFRLNALGAALVEDQAGNVGEVRLVSGDGKVLSVFHPVQADAVTVPASPACTGADVDAEVTSEQGGAVLRASRPVAELGACVDAYMPLAPALAPAERLRETLIGAGLLFTAVAGVFALVLAYWVRASARRLAVAAAGIGEGSPDVVVVPSGPSELRALGVAMQSMSGKVTRRIRAEEMARREAEAGSAAKDRFVTMLSQELRTLVTTVQEWFQSRPPAA